MKSTVVIKNVNNYFIRIAFILIVTILPNLNCFSQNKNKSIFILFEKNIDGMYKWYTYGPDSCYYYTINPKRPIFWYGFRPKKDGEIISLENFEKNIKPQMHNINWIRDLCTNHPDSLTHNSNITIVEKLNDSNYRLVPCIFFEAIE